MDPVPPTPPRPLGLTPPQDQWGDFLRRLFGMTPMIPEGRETFLALVPDRYKSPTPEWDR